MRNTSKATLSNNRTPQVTWRRRKAPCHSSPDETTPLRQMMTPSTKACARSRATSMHIRAAGIESKMDNQMKSRWGSKPNSDQTRTMIEIEFYIHNSNPIAIDIRIGSEKCRGNSGIEQTESNRFGSHQQQSRTWAEWACTFHLHLVKSTGTAPLEGGRPFREAAIINR